MSETFSLGYKGLKYRLPFMLLLPSEPLIKPLRQIPRFQEIVQQVLRKSSNPIVPKKKYKKSYLKEQDETEYVQRLTEYIQREKPYLQPDLTLRKLAAMIEIHPNHLSQLLNDRIGHNFSEYINSFRLDTFKSKAADTSNHHLTILALAYESGFSSKTVFNTFFKKGWV